MRCPKCGYISFDQVETCGKCSVSFAESGGTFVGTVLKVEGPSFLSSVLGGEASGEESGFDLAGAVVDSTEGDMSEVADEGVPMVDLSQFDEDQEDESPEDEEESEFSLALPDDEEEPEISLALPDDEEEPEISLALPDEDEEHEISLTPPEEEEHEISLALPEDEEESGISALESTDEEEGGIEFPLEDDEGPGLDFALEEPIGLEEEKLDLDLESPEAEFESEEMPTINLEDAEEHPAPKSASEASASDLSLDLNVDIEDDEPEDDDMVFNLEDIDMSDLVIEESKDSAGGVPEDSALDLEDYLNTGESNDTEPPPMDLSLEDGQLVEDESENKDDNLPEIEL